MQQSVSTGFQLSAQQKQLWAADSNRPAPATIAVLLEGPLDLPRLQLVLQQLAERHEILRTVFRRQPGMRLPFQIVAEVANPEWREVDLRDVPATEQPANIDLLLAEESKHIFDLERGPILRAGLITLELARHVLLLSLPALCADSTTLNILVREVAGRYGQADVADVFQYADYAAWQGDLLGNQDDSSEAAKAFWSDRKLNCAPPLRLPFETQAADASCFEPRSIAVSIAAEALKQAGACGAEFFLACWYVLLWRMSGQSEVMVANIADGRTQPELADAMGLFARALPVRVQLEGSQKFAEVLANVQQAMAEAAEWQDYFDQADGHKAAASFRLQPRLPKLNSAGVSFTVYKQRSGTVRFSTELVCTHGEGHYSLEFNYDPQALSPHVAEYVARCYEALVKSAVRQLDSKISAIEVLGESDRRQVIVDFNGRAVEFSQQKTLHELFQEQVSRTPDLPALRFEEEDLTYVQLNARVNRLAHYLRQCGIGPNKVVGLCVERSAEMIIGLLGILKAGGAYVPLLPDNPKNRLAQQLADAGVTVLLTQERLLPVLPGFSGVVLCLDRDASQLNCQSQENPEHKNTSQDLAYVIYTSGSTGVPKGVAVRHSNLVNYSQFVTKRLGLAQKPALHFATVSTLGADLGNTCIFPSLIAGGCLHVISYECSIDGKLFSAYVSKHPIDVIKITPSHLAALFTQAGKVVLPRKYLISGGEAFTWDLVRHIQAAGASCEIVNHYGPTEATIGCCTFAPSENNVTKWKPATVPIGRPIANAQIYILDSASLIPLPVGVPGELCIGGAGIAAGYLNQPEQTRERFLPDPFSKSADARMYRTGDLARFLPDGNVEFLGRIDHQIKIRGFRVELAEIESVLKQQSNVGQALVVAQESKSGDKRLVAYVVPRTQQLPRAEEMRSFLQQRLPEYMVPASFVVMDAFPLNANGKIDRQSLPAPDQAQAEVVVAAPENPVEEAIAAIWTEVLGVPRVGRSDNFFDLGGHSLLATQVVSRVRTRFLVQLPLRALFEAPTIAGLAKVVGQSQPEQAGENVADLLAELEGLSEEEAEQLLISEEHRAAGRAVGD